MDPVLHFFPRHRAMTQTPTGLAARFRPWPGTSVPGFHVAPLRGWCPPNPCIVVLMISFMHSCT